MKKKTAQNKKTPKPQKTRTVKVKAAPNSTAVKRPRGRPRRLDASNPPTPTTVKQPRGRPRLPDTPTPPDQPPVPPTPPEPPPPPLPLPPQPPAEEKPDLTQALLLRLISPLKSLPVQTAEAMIYLRPEDIAYVRTTESRRVIIFDIFGGEWQRFDLLSELEKRLKGDPRFFRTHKSFLVNVFAVKQLRKNPETGLYELYFGDKVKGFAQAASGNMRELRDRLEL